MTAQTIYIVIKCGNSANIHAAKELDKVIKKHGYAWFAKFGTSLKYEKFDLQNPNLKLVLCVALMFNREYEIYSYKIEEFNRMESPKKGTFPNYYNELLEDVGTWIKVSKLDAPQPTINDLLVKSSYIKLSQTIKKAKAGFFYCRHFRD